MIAFKPCASVRVLPSCTKEKRFLLNVLHVPLHITGHCSPQRHVFTPHSLGVTIDAGERRSDGGTGKSLERIVRHSFHDRRWHGPDKRIGSTVVLVSTGCEAYRGINGAQSDNLILHTKNRSRDGDECYGQSELDGARNPGRSRSQAP